MQRMQEEAQTIITECAVVLSSLSTLNVSCFSRFPSWGPPPLAYSCRSPPQTSPPTLSLPIVDTNLTFRGTAFRAKELDLSKRMNNFHLCPTPEFRRKFCN